MDIHFALRNPIYCLLMSSPEIYEEVESLYLKNEQHYKKVLETIQLKDSFFNGLQATDKWGILMLHAVTKEMEESDEKMYLNYIEQLIKKSFKRIYDFTVMNGFNISLFYQYVANREPNLDDMKASLYNCLHLYIAKDLPSFNLVMDVPTNIFFENLRLTAQPSSVKTDMVTNDTMDEAIAYYQKITRKKWRKGEVKLIRSIVVEIEKETYKKHPSIAREIQRTGNTRLLYKEKPLSYLRQGLSILNLLDFDNIYFMLDLRITQEEWALLYLSYEYSFDKGFGEEDIDMIMMFGLVQLAHTKAYRKLEDAFWASHLRVDESAVLEKKKALEEDKRDLMFRSEQLKKEEHLYKQREAELLERLAEMEAKLKKSEQENASLAAELEKNASLLPSMQNHLFHSDDEIHASYQSEENPVEVAKSLLEGKNVVLVGGHDKFRRKMATLLPNLYTISPDEKHIGLTQIESADVVLFDTSYNNHAQFNRLKSSLKEQRVVFLNQGSSVEQNLARVVMELSDK